MFARFDDARTDAHTHARTDNVKTVYPPQTKFAGGIKNEYSYPLNFKIDRVGALNHI